MIEFVDTNVLVYAHDGGAGRKHQRAIELISGLAEDATGALSIQVLAEFYNAATRKLGMTGHEAEDAISDFGRWTIHCAGHADLLRAAQLQRKFRLSWWDALIVNSALELSCATLWTEDLSNRQRYGTVQARNPFV